MKPCTPRRAFTLVELLVVITIILVITAIGAATLPRFLDNQNQTRAVDQLSQWLLTARQRAKRDRRPTGLRLLVDPTTQMVSQCAYVQQPDPYSSGECLGVSPDPLNPQSAIFRATTVDFQGAAPQPGGVDPAYGELAVVTEGDYVELNGGGHVFYIYHVDALSLSLGLTNTVQSAQPTDYYRIIRQPRRIIGEDVLTLPQDMAIDLTLNPPVSGQPIDYSSTVYSQNVPVRSIVGGGKTLTLYEILFSPDGSVVGRGTPSGQIRLWVRNTTNPNPIDPKSSSLVCVQVRTGFISAHPVAVGANPYLFTLDGRASGM